MDSHHRPSHKTGLPPGSLVHIGTVPEHETRISVIDYTTETVAETVIASVNELLPFRDSDTVTWVMVEGLADISVIEDIGDMFGIHHLALEDILNTHQRPKFEEFEDYLFIVLKALLSEGNEFAVSHEQVSILVLEKVVFTCAMYPTTSSALSSPSSYTVTSLPVCWTSTFPVSATA